MKTILVDAAYCFTIEIDGKFVIFKEMYELLETYKNKKIILTNANDEQIIKFGLSNVPYDIFTLKHNPDKINPEYYRLLLDTFKLNKEDVIYFEHSIEAVSSAKSVGIDTYYYDSEKKDLKSLKNFLDENLK